MLDQKIDIEVAKLAIQLTLATLNIEKEGHKNVYVNTEAILELYNKYFTGIATTVKE